MRRTLLALLLSCALPALAVAQTPTTPFFHQGLDRLHPPDSALPNESVDPASGTLTIVATDLVLPGNAGFNLTIQRVYNSAIFPNYPSSTDVEERSWAGVGWKLHFGRILYADSQISGQMAVEMGDGSRHPLYHSVNNPNIWTTTDFWLYNPATGVLQLPNGQVYTFGRDVYLNATLGDVLYVTQITDPFGNAITFNYFTDPNAPLDGIASIHQTLSSTESRDVTFGYDNTLHALSSMTYSSSTGTHTWQYAQVGSGPDGDPLLMTVTPPAGASTSYGYGSGGSALNGEISTINAPFGGTINYTYQDETRVAGGYTTTTRVVATRSVSGHYVTNGTWSYVYGAGSNQDTTVITCGCGGTTSYRFNGTGASADFSAWSAGTIAEITVADGSGTLDDRTLTWARGDPVSNDPISGPNGIWSDPAVYRPLLATQSVTRNGHTWTTTNTYHAGDGSLNDFGQPYDILQQGETIYQFRHTTVTFQGGFTPYMAEKVLSTTVTERSSYATWDGTVSSSYSYDLATGFLTGETILGIPTSFGERADGNVSSSTDARGNVTSFTYDWGLVNSIQTPNLHTTYLIYPEGLISTETRNDTTTTYLYDLAERLTSVQTTGMNATTYAYDDLHGAWIKEFQGSSTITHDTDGFAREIMRSNSAGLTVWLARDACGRVFQVSDPYTSDTAPYTTLNLDALGRTTQVTDPAGNITRYAYLGGSVTRTDPNGHTTTFASMVFGDPNTSNLTGVTDATGTQTVYQYDVSGVLAQVSGPGSGVTRSWTVSNGLVTSETQPESGTTQYTYDPAGNLASMTDANSLTTNYTYDGDNRLTNRQNPVSADTLAITYDATGRVHTLSGGGTTTTFTHNVSNQTVTRSDVTPIGTFTSTYQNDPNGNLSQITYPSGRVVTYSYDAENRLLAVNYTPPGSHTNIPFATSFQPDDAGRLLSYVTGAVTHQFTYYPGGRPEHVYTTGGTATLDLTYAYDAAWNVNAITDPRSGASEGFTLDALDRLTSASGPWGTLQWTYDAGGNRLTETSSTGTSTYAYDAPTQRFTAITGANPENFYFDSDGNVTYDQNPLTGNTTQFTYSPLGKLTGASPSAGSGPTAAYTYDATDERLSSTVNSQTLYTIRGPDSQTLSEYVPSCGVPVWTRDLIYAGGQLLGAAKATTSVPSVTMQTSATSVYESAPSVTLTVQLSTPGGGPLGCPVTVSYSTADGTATAGSDYTATSGSLTFESGSGNGATQTITVPMINDGDANETFSVNLTGATGGTLGTTADTAVTITNNPPPTISINNVAQYQGTSGTTPFVFTVSLSAATYQAVQVSYATSNQTALAGRDYQYTSGTLTIAAGASSGTITVPVYSSITHEANQTFTVALSSPVNATFGVNAGTGTIENDVPLRHTWGDFYVPRDGAADVAFMSATTGIWTFRDSDTGALQTFGPFGSLAQGDIPVPADYNGDGITDCAYYRPSTGVWTIALSCNAANVYTVSYGGDPSDVPVPADYDGDGKADIAIYQASTGNWSVLYSGGGELIYTWGWTWTTTIPVPGDYDGDGKADLAYYAQYNSSWWIMQSSTWTLAPVVTNNLGNVPVIATPGDYDGDGKTDCALYYPGNQSWYIVPSSTGVGYWFAYGASDAVPVPADYDGDGKFDVAIYSPSEQLMWVYQSSTNSEVAINTSNVAQSGDVPVLQKPQ